MIAQAWRTLTANWQIKVVALFLAVALWLYTSGQARVDRTLTVKVPESAVLSLPSDYQVTAIEPGEFTVDIDAPTGVLRAIKKDEITPALVVSAGALNEGRQTFPITNRVLGLDPDARILRIHPETVSSVTVAFAKIVDEHLPVEMPSLSDVPAGLEPTVTLDRTRVVVRGPRSVIEGMRKSGQKIRFQPIQLAGARTRISQPTEDRLSLTPDPPQGVSVLETVVATVKLAPVVGVRQVVQLPVNVLAGRDFLRKFDVELSQPAIAVALRGPKNLLDALKPDEDVMAYVSLRRPFEPNVAQEVPVQFLAPSWLSWDPVTIRVTVSLAPAR